MPSSPKRIRPGLRDNDAAIFSNGIEQLALQVFNKKNRLIPILGFDTSFSSRENDINESFCFGFKWNVR